MEFYSKRNKVSLIEYKGKRAVKKQFFEENCCKRESEFYKQMSKELLVPQVLEAGLDFLILEYIQGMNMLELLEYQEEHGFDQEPWVFLWKWIKACGTSCGLIPSEGNLRNFIWETKARKLYGIDFENYEEGTIDLAYGHIIVQLKDYKGISQKIIQEIISTCPMVSTHTLSIAEEKMRLRRCQWKRQ